MRYSLFNLIRPVAESHCPYRSCGISGKDYVLVRKASSGVPLKDSVDGTFVVDSDVAMGNAGSNPTTAVARMEILEVRSRVAR